MVTTELALGLVIMKRTINKRQPIYFSDSKDADLIKYLSPLLKHKSFSQLIKELVRDGIKYRHNPKPEKVLQSITPNLHAENPPLQNIELRQKEISNDDIENRLDKF